MSSSNPVSEQLRQVNSEIDRITAATQQLRAQAYTLGQTASTSGSSLPQGGNQISDDTLPGVTKIRGPVDLPHDQPVPQPPPESTELTNLLRGLKAASTALDGLHQKN